MTVRDLEPKVLWNHFEDLNAVPRPSKKEERIRQFMVDFGKGLGLDTKVDKIRLFYKVISTWFTKKTWIQILILIHKE